jgi:chemotaxis protein MotB
MADEAKRPIIIVKKKAGHGGHHGGAWKVAYADFVTAMMALFIVLWLLNTSQQTKEAIAGYFRDPLGQGKELGSLIKGTEKSSPTTFKSLAEAKSKDLQDVKKELEAAMKMVPHFDKVKANVEFFMTEEGLRIELLESSKGMFFESGKPEPSDIGKEVLRTVAEEIGKLPNRVLIEGHTDSTPYGSAAYSNWELSSDRANEARKLMVGNGVKTSQVEEIRGFADQKLRNPRDPADPSNRRVSVIVKYLDKAPELKLGSNAGAKLNNERESPAPAAKTPAASGGHDPKTAALTSPAKKVA